MSEQDRSRLYAWWCEQADESLAEYVMSCLSPVPLPDLATKDDFRVLKSDFVRLESKFERLVDAREADRKEARHQFRWLAGIGVSILGVVVGLGIFS